MRSRKRPQAPKPYTPPPVLPPSPEVLAFRASMADIFSNMRTQIDLDLMAKTHAVGLLHKVTCRDNYLTAEVRTQELDVLASFTIGTWVNIGEVVLRLDVSSTFCDYFDEADTRFKALSALMEVARMIHKTYVQTWRFKA